MAETNVPLETLATTEGMDFSHRGTPLTPTAPEHYANKAYIDAEIDEIAEVTGRIPATVDIVCDGTAETYTVTHDLNSLKIASVQVYDTTDGANHPIGIDWEPATLDTITLKPDVVFPATMTLRVIVAA